MNYQKLTIVGNVTADPQPATSKKGDVTYTRFSVGAREGKHETVFFPIAAFGKTGENVARFVSKGREVLVEGRIRVSKAGIYTVVADRVVFGAAPKAVQAEEPGKPA